jgi:hypothetical protein
MRFSKSRVRIAAIWLNFSRAKLPEIARSVKKRLLMTAQTMAAVNGALLHQRIRAIFARNSNDPKIDFTGTVYDFASVRGHNSRFRFSHRMAAESLIIFPWHVVPCSIFGNGVFRNTV